MGESEDNILALAYATRRLGIDSVPVNFLAPIKGTPLGATRTLTPEKCLKAAGLFRLLNPTSEVRARAAESSSSARGRATSSTPSIRFS